MALEIVRQDNKFRVQTQYFTTEFLPDTPANRKTMVVALRLMQNENSNKLFTFQKLARITRNTIYSSEIDTKLLRQCISTFRQ